MVKADERQRQILVRARTDGRVEVGSLAADLAVAEETVRRDLRELVERGVLQRVHGGAYPVESAGLREQHQAPVDVLVAEKRRIAVAAADRLHGAETIYVDEGVTPQFVAEELAPESPITVVTSSLLAAGALAETPNVTVLLLGGRMRGRTLATVDHWALRMLGDLVIDLAFLGSNGISREHGLDHARPGRRSGQERRRRAVPAPRLRRPAHASSGVVLLPLRRDLGLRGPGHRLGSAERGPTGSVSSDPQVVRASAASQRPRQIKARPRTQRLRPSGRFLEAKGSSGDQIDEKDRDGAGPASSGRLALSGCAGAVAGAAGRMAAQVDQRPDGRQPADGRTSRSSPRTASPRTPASR